VAYRGHPSRGSLADHLLGLLSPDLRSSLEQRVSELRRLGIEGDEWEFNVKPLLTPLTVRSVTAKLVKRILRPSEDVEVQATAMFTPIMLSSLDTILTFVHWGSGKYKLFYETTFEADKVSVSPFGILWSSEFKDIDVTKISGLPLDAYIVNTIRFPKVTFPNEIEPLTDSTFIIVGDRDVSIYTIYKSVCRLVGDVRRSRFKGRDYRNVVVEFVDRNFRVQKLLMDMPVEDLEVIGGQGESFNALIVREDLVEGGKRRGPLYTAHLLDLARVSGFQVGDVELPLELFEFLRDEYTRSEGLVSFRLDFLKLRDVLSYITRYFRKGSYGELWVKVLNDNEFLKLMINSTGIYRVKGDSVVYFNPLIAEFILVQGGALSIDVRMADVPFEIALAMEEFSREIKAYDLRKKPLDILRLRGATQKLKDRFEQVLGIRVRDEGIIHKLNGLLYHSKVYNVVVEGVSG
jgi:hypothetical protein